MCDKAFQHYNTAILKILCPFLLQNLQFLITWLCEYTFKTISSLDLNSSQEGIQICFLPQCACRAWTVQKQRTWQSQHCSAMVPPPSSRAGKWELHLSGTRWWAPRQGHPAVHGLDHCAPERWHPGDLTGAAPDTQGSIPCTHATHEPRPHPPCRARRWVTKLLQPKNCQADLSELTPPAAESLTRASAAWLMLCSMERRHSCSLNLTDIGI